MLKKILTTLLLISVMNSFSQDVITGKMNPAGNYSWMILYKLNGVSQSYVQNTTVKDGKFSITIPKGSEPGMYRLSYDNINNRFIDVIYNKENIDLEFHPEHPIELVKFTKSKENMLFQDYIREIADVNNSLDSLQVVYFNEKGKSKKTENLYSKKLKLSNSIQDTYEKKSTDKLSNHFIKANKRYFTTKLIKDKNAYLKSLKAHFFDYVDFNNQTLSKSSLLIDRILKYVFLLNTSNDPKMLLKLREDAVNTVVSKIHNIDLKKDVIESLMYTFAQKENTVMVKSLIQNHFNKLPVALQDYKFKNAVLDMVKTTIGQMAPEITWEEKGETKNLYSLKGSEYYIVLFWSSTCSHCLKELPVLHKYLKDKPNVKVVAIGLETNQSKYDWIDLKYDYDDFIHIMGENKYKNQYVRDYGVSSTPNFFLLNSDKKIIAKPYDVKKLKAFFNSKK